jgi:acyl-CoA synthetase (AMP-forming)/AMP-acid ligase II/acyl carrier protein
MVRYSHWIAVLKERCEARGSALLYRFLTDESADPQTLTFAQLDARAKAIAAALQSRNAQGQPVLLLHPPGLEFIAALMGCLYAGAIAVAAQPPHSLRQERALARLTGIIQNARPALALTSASNTAAMQAALATHFPISVLATDTLDPSLASQWREPAIGPDTIAALQYTSGTTSDPKGVVLTHANLLHNAQVVKEAFAHTPDGQGVIWLPPYHDMGLMGGIFQPLYVGSPVTLMAPATFLQRPIRWLQAITRYRGSTSGGPNFAYDLCVDAIPDAALDQLDLSSWTIAFNGAEPVRRQTMDRFTAKFERCGFRASAFRPCYGLAEATLMVTCAGEDPNAKPVEVDSPVNCGKTDGASTVLIANPQTFVPCPAGEVGEIWIQSPSVACGYWERPQETAAVFQARPASTAPAPDGPFLRSGDLGFLRDGELFVTGRLKDLIIIRGVNHYPHDIERTAQEAHQALQIGGGAAFAVDMGGPERLVLFHELKRSTRNEPAHEVMDAIRQAISASHDVEVHAIALLKPGRLPRTPSGKCRRQECRRMFEQGDLDALARWTRQDPSPMPVSAAHHSPAPLNAESLRAWLATEVASLLGMAADEISLDQPLARYGLGSADAVGLAGRLSEQLQRDLDATLLWDYPSIDALADYLTRPDELEQAAL